MRDHVGVVIEELRRPTGAVAQDEVAALERMLPQAAPDVPASREQIKELESLRTVRTILTGPAERGDRDITKL